MKHPVFSRACVYVTRVKVHLHSLWPARFDSFLFVSLTLTLTLVLSRSFLSGSHSFSRCLCLCLALSRRCARPFRAHLISSLSPSLFQYLAFALFLSFLFSLSLMRTRAFSHAHPSLVLSRIVFDLCLFCGSFALSLSAAGARAILTFLPCHYELFDSLPSTGPEDCAKHEEPSPPSESNLNGTRRFLEARHHDAIRGWT